MKGYNLPDNVSPNDPDAPWNKEEQEELNLLEIRRMMEGDHIPGEKVFVIKNTITGEYWSNEIGWVERDSATFFTEDEKDTFLYIPLDGEWETFEEE